LLQFLRNTENTNPDTTRTEFDLCEICVSTAHKVQQQTHCLQ